MSILGATDIGKGLLTVTVDHDPTVVSTDVPKGSCIIDANGVHYIKLDNGATTNVGATSLLDKVAQYTRQQNIKQASLSIVSSLVAWDFNTESNALLVMDEIATLSNPTNDVQGARYLLTVRQDSTGYALSFGSNYVILSGTINVSASAVNFLRCICENGKIYITIEST